jgi:hypothetical protein
MYLAQNIRQHSPTAEGERTLAAVDPPPAAVESSTGTSHENQEITVVMVLSYSVKTGKVTRRVRSTLNISIGI